MEKQCLSCPVRILVGMGGDLAGTLVRLGDDRRDTSRGLGAGAVSPDAFHRLSHGGRVECEACFAVINVQYSMVNFQLDWG